MIKRSLGFAFYKHYVVIPVIQNSSTSTSISIYCYNLNDKNIEWIRHTEYCDSNSSANSINPYDIVLKKQQQQQRHFLSNNNLMRIWTAVGGNSDSHDYPTSLYCIHSGHLLVLKQQQFACSSPNINISPDNKKWSFTAIPLSTVVAQNSVVNKSLLSTIPDASLVPITNYIMTMIPSIRMDTSIMNPYDSSNWYTSQLQLMPKSNNVVEINVTNSNKQIKDTSNKNSILRATVHNNDDTIDKGIPWIPTSIYSHFTRFNNADCDENATIVAVANRSRTTSSLMTYNMRTREWQLVKLVMNKELEFNYKHTNYFIDTIVIQVPKINQTKQLPDNELDEEDEDDTIEYEHRTVIVVCSVSNSGELSVYEFVLPLTSSAIQPIHPYMLGTYSKTVKQILGKDMLLQQQEQQQKPSSSSMVTIVTSNKL